MADLSRSQRPNEPVSQNGELDARIRQAAQAWGQTIAGVFTVGGIVAYLQGGAELAAKPMAAQVLVMVTLAGALLLAAFAIWRAFEVAWGTPPGWAKGQEPLKRLEGSKRAVFAALVLLTMAGSVLLIPDAQSTRYLEIARIGDDKQAYGPDDRMVFNQPTCQEPVCLPWKYPSWPPCGNSLPP